MVVSFFPQSIGEIPSPRAMGFPEDTVWVAVRHSDKTHDHIHIVASRISLGGKVFTGEFDARRAIRVTQEMEKEYDLTRTKGLDGVGKAMSDGERRRMMRTESLSEKQWLRMLQDITIPSDLVALTDKFKASFENAGFCDRFKCITIRTEPDYQGPSVLLKDILEKHVP